MFSVYVESEEYNGTTSSTTITIATLTLQKGTYMIGYVGGGWLVSNDMIQMPAVLFRDDMSLSTLNMAHIISITSETILKLCSPTRDPVQWYNVKLYALRLK